jgi:DNA-binding protein YbaB
MDNSTLNPDEARDRVAAWRGRIEKLAADTKEMSDRFQQLEVTAGDPRGMAEVTVDNTGALTGLRLTREIERVSPEEVASTIMRTIRTAKAEIADRSQEIIEETVGTESPAARAIAGRVADQLRPRDDEPEYSQHSSKYTQDTGGRRIADLDEDDGDTTIWR